MRVIRHPLPGGPETALAIGSFDGVHRGHAAVLARVRASASARGHVPAVLTFEPLPREVLVPDSAPPRLTTLPEKILALEANGIERVFAQRFHAGFAARDPENFARWLARSLGARWIVVGADFRFGAKRAGTAPMLAELGARFGFEVSILPDVEEGGERISSSRVRAALAAGHLDLAARLLGRPYSIRGRVMHGAKRGRELGFPTANIRLGRAKPALGGIFAVKCFGAATRGLEGVASLGTNPAVRTGGPATLEAHLFDFQGDLYGRHLTLEFHKKLRDEANFASLDALTAQIRQDCDDARSFFGERAR